MALSFCSGSFMRRQHCSQDAAAISPSSTRPSKVLRRFPSTSMPSTSSSTLSSSSSLEIGTGTALALALALARTLGVGGAASSAATSAAAAVSSRPSSTFSSACCSGSSASGSPLAAASSAAFSASRAAAAAAACSASMRALLALDICSSTTTFEGSFREHWGTQPCSAVMKKYLRSSLGSTHSSSAMKTAPGIKYVFTSASISGFERMPTLFLEVTLNFLAFSSAGAAFRLRGAAFRLGLMGSVPSSGTGGLRGADFRLGLASTFLARIQTSPSVNSSRSSDTSRPPNTWSSNSKVKRSSSVSSRASCFEEPSGHWISNPSMLATCSPSSLSQDP
mmetsp:Transcript_20282/g.47693  ORF Transcript_20282/g.47693 Transcript_20282/m.47693 type:complete len:336 (-) Transcript_20282:136-1143(-)